MTLAADNCRKLYETVNRQQFANTAIQQPKIIDREIFLGENQFMGLASI
jgi:hypothetical protein